MKPAVVVVLIMALMTAGSQSPYFSPDGERFETGGFRTTDGHLVPYRIRLLPVSSFPGLPHGLASRLERMRCMIPQSFEARAPENVVEGAFRAPGSSDWAVLCSVDHATTLYVFFDGQYDNPASLRSQPDTLWLGAEPGSSVYGSAWGIALRDAASLSEFRQLHGMADIDHDGIEDAHLEHSSTVHYWNSGRWLDLSSGHG